jgi:Holliday junction resolvasome RuvABC DNA-binding subunit
VFKHADGTPYGGGLDPVATDRNAQVFSALRTMGFKERDCRAAVDGCSRNLGPTATREEMLRAALGMLAS